MILGGMAVLSDIKRYWLLGQGHKMTSLRVLKWRKHYLVAVLGSSAVALHAAPWTVTSHGVIGWGYDTYGTFFDGVPQVTLNGQRFTLTTSIDPTDFSNQGSTYEEW